MRILVTGGCGFIGGHLVRLLSEERHTVVIIDNLSSGNYNNIAQIHPTPFVRIVDCRDYDFLREISDWGPFDFIYHLAATVGVNRVLKDPKECIDNNIQGLRAVLSLGVPGIFTSTSEVYGKTTETLKEGSDCIFSDRPRWSYATSKLIGEWLALAENWKVVRLFNVVGPGQSSSYGAVLPRFVTQAICGQPITVFGDGSQIRAFINVKDCVKILYELMQKNFDTVNIGSMDVLSIGELAYRVREKFKPHSVISYVPYEVAYGAGFEDCLSRIPNLTKLQSLIGDRKYISLGDTIDELAVSLKGVTPIASRPLETQSINKSAGSVALHSGS